MAGVKPAEKPPDIGYTYSRNLEAAVLVSGKGKRNQRTLPIFLDSENRYGDVEYLLLQGINEAPLPRKPFVIGKSVDLAAGSAIAGATSESRGTKYTLEVRCKPQVDKLLAMTKLIDNTPVEVIYHPTRNVCRCVATCWDVADVDTDEILENLRDQGVINIRRITRRTSEGITNTGTMILTMKGTVPPEYVKFGLLRVPTRPYYPAPMLCFRCFSYGHTKMHCTQEEKCHNCSETHDKAQSCDKTAYCCNCKLNHQPMSRECPVYCMEKEIIKIKIDEGLTYIEAKNAHKTRITASKGTFASNVQQRLTNPQISELTQLVKQREDEKQKILAENEEMRKQIAKLQQALKQVMENQKKLNEQLKQKSHDEKLPLQFETPISLTQKPSSSKRTLSQITKDEQIRMLTRQQFRNDSRYSNKSNASGSETDTQSSQKRKPVYSPPKKPLKQHKQDTRVSKLSVENTKSSDDILNIGTSSNEDTATDEELASQIAHN